MGVSARIGGCELLEELGRGGMGAVYRARDASGRDVALKLLLRGREATAAQRERFVREALALARLRHPNVVAVLDAGEDQGVPFLVTALVPGETLAARLARERTLPVREAVSLVRKLAEGIAHCHVHGVLHRDLKPENVLLGPGGEPVVSDFGLTRDVEPEASRTATQAGGLLGTPGWWAPEQARGEVASPHSDVYGLGAVLVGALTGEPPHGPVTTLADALSLTERPVAPPSRARADGVDDRLDAVCLRALALDPAERYPDARALAEDLARWLRGAPPLFGRAPSRRARLPLAVVALPAAGALAALALLGGGGPAPEESRPAASASTTPAPASAADPELESVAGLVDRAAVRLQRRDVEGALEDCERAIALDPSCAAAYLNRGVARGQRGDRVGALADYDRALALAPETPMAHAHRGGRLAKERPDAALVDLERAIALDPGCALAYAYRGSIRDDRGDHSGARGDYDRALALDPTSPLVLHLRGVLRASEGDLEGSLQDLDRAIALDPGDALAHGNRSLSRERLGDRAGARTDLLRAIEIEPRRAGGYVQLGSLMLREKDHAGALAMFDQAIGYEPRNAQAHMERGVAVELLGDETGAFASYSRAIELDPRSAEAHANRGLIHGRRGRLEAAAADLRRALELFPPGGDRAREMQELLAKLAAATPGGGTSPGGSR